MTASVNLVNAKSRTESGSTASRRMRKQQGLIPAIVYGLGDKENLKIAVDAKDWEVFSKLDIQVVKLKIDKKRPLNVLLKDVQHNALSNSTFHIDFQEIDMKEEITATIPVYSHGTAAGLSQGGILTQVEHEIEVACLPNDLPESVEVDIAGLELDAAILAKDIVLPENVKLVSDLEMAIFHVHLPKTQSSEATEEAEGEGEATEEAAKE